jgi:hypothetical protein
MARRPIQGQAERQTFDFGDNKKVELTHGELCELVRRMSGLFRLMPPKAPSRKAWFYDQEKKLSIQLEQSRRDTLMYKPVKQLISQEITLPRSMVSEKAAGITDSEWQSLIGAVKSAVERPLGTAEAAPGPDDLSGVSGKATGRLSAFARMLDLPSGSQSGLAQLAGEYLIFRPLIFRRGVVVSHMTVAAGTTASQPATFTTNGPRGGLATDAAVVDGVLYETNDCIFCIGKVRGSPEIRSTLLRRNARNGTRDGPDDLIGIRVGLGRAGNQPQAYRTWCTRLDSPASEIDWPSMIGEYDWERFRGNAMFQQINRFDFIARWLETSKHITLYDPEDPVSWDGRVPPGQPREKTQENRRVEAGCPRIPPAQDAGRSA